MASMKGLKKSILEDGMQLYVQKDKIGEIGWTSNELNKSLGLKKKVYVADLDWDMIISLGRSEEHTSELQSRPHLVCRLLLEKKKKIKNKLEQMTQIS